MPKLQIWIFFVLIKLSTGYYPNNTSDIYGYGSRSSGQARFIPLIVAAIAAGTAVSSAALTSAIVSYLLFILCVFKTVLCNNLPVK